MGLPRATMEEEELSWGHTYNALTLVMADELKTENNSLCIIFVMF